MSAAEAPAGVLARLRDRAGEALRRPPAGERFLDKPYASVQLLLLAAGGLLVFGVLMAVSTTIAASHQADGSGSARCGPR